MGIFTKKHPTLPFRGDLNLTFYLTELKKFNSNYDDSGASYKSKKYTLDSVSAPYIKCLAHSSLCGKRMLLELTLPDYRLPCKYIHFFSYILIPVLFLTLNFLLSINSKHWPSQYDKACVQRRR